MIPQIAKQETPYFPNSQSIAAIVFENIKDYYVPEEEQTREKMKQMLVKGIKVAEAEYTRELNLPHQLSASISLMEVAAAAV